MPGLNDQLQLRAIGDKRSRLTKNQVLGYDAWPLSLCLTNILSKHNGCVNTVRWDDEGKYLISGSDDRGLGIWSAETYKLRGFVQTSHENNIFCAKFVPGTNNTKIISCAADGEIHFSETEYSTTKAKIKCKQTLPIYGRDHIAMKFEFLPSTPSAFITTFQDGTVTLIDTRDDFSKQNFEKIIVNLRLRNREFPCYSLHFNPLEEHTFALSAYDPAVRIFDIRKASEAGFGISDCLQKFVHPSLENQVEKRVLHHETHNATDVQFSGDGELLVNYSCFDVVLFDYTSWNTSTKLEKTSVSVIQQYTGRQNSDTFLKEARFYGNGRYIITGGDSGEVFIWDKISGKLIRKIAADANVVNGVAPHPFLPTIASCGIDDDIKIFQPIFSPNLDYKVEVDNISNHAIPLIRSRFSVSEKIGFIVQDDAKFRPPQADRLRNEGNESFKKGDYTLALEKYKAAVRHLNYTPPGLEQRKLQREALKLLYSNLAAASIKLENWGETVSMATKAIKLDPDNSKAYYRRAFGKFELEEFVGAKEDITKAHALAPKDPNIIKLYRKIYLAPQNVETNSTKKCTFVSK